MEARCSECGERAIQEPPSTWDPAWGPIPGWSHEDGEPLCPVDGDNAPCSVVFI